MVKRNHKALWDPDIWPSFIVGISVKMLGSLFVCLFGGFLGFYC